MKIVHVVNLFPTDDSGTLTRRAMAMRTWLSLWSQGVTPAIHVLQPGERNARNIGDARALPPVADIIDCGLNFNADAIILTNDDTCIALDALPVILNSLKEHGCYYSRRMDFTRIDRAMTIAQLKTGRTYGGADLFAFTRKWWAANRSRWPDVFIGVEGWDFVFKKLMHESGFTEGSPVIYHQSHLSQWQQELTTGKAQRHNRRECEAWAKANGYEDYLGRSGKYLFSVDRLEKATAKVPVCIVQLGRAGDLLNILPIAKYWADQQRGVTVVVQRSYAPILDGTSYVSPVVVDGPIDKVMCHVAAMKKQFPESEIIVTQNCGDFAFNRQSKSFTLESWRKCGLEHLWHDLPLVFDQRDGRREIELVHSVLGQQIRPVVLLSLSGHSSPYRHAAELKAYLESRWEDHFSFVDISNVIATRIYDTLALMERSAAMVTIDTAPLHLGYACGIPTIALTADMLGQWYRSAPRNHWILDLPYSTGKAGWSKIDDVLGLVRATPRTKAIMKGELQESLR